MMCHSARPIHIRLSIGTDSRSCRQKYLLKSNIFGPVFRLFDATSEYISFQKCISTSQLPQSLCGSLFCLEFCHAIPIGRQWMQAEIGNPFQVQVIETVRLLLLQLPYCLFGAIPLLAAHQFQSAMPLFQLALLRRRQCFLQTPGFKNRHRFVLALDPHAVQFAIGKLRRCGARGLPHQDADTIHFGNRFKTSPMTV